MTSNLPKTPSGVVQSYFENVVMTNESDECLFWPYSTTVKGYPCFYANGAQRLAHRVLCERVNGPPPTLQHHAAHSCGNGRKGCVNRRHVSWKTAAENAADKDMHGTHARGEKSVSAKLTDEKVRQIRGLSGKLSQDKIAAAFGICQSHVRNIINRKRWNHI